MHEHDLESRTLVTALRRAKKQQQQPPAAAVMALHHWVMLLGVCSTTVAIYAGDVRWLAVGAVGLVLLSIRQAMR